MAKRLNYGIFSLENPNAVSARSERLCAISFVGVTLHVAALLRRLIRDPLLWITGMLFLFYWIWVSMRPAGVFWSPDEGGKYVHILSMIDTGSATAPLVYPGRYLDHDFRYVPLFFWSHVGDRIFSWWPTGFPLATLPFYLWFGPIGLYVIPALSGALCAWLAGVLARQIWPHRRWLPAASTLITGLGTPVAFYSTTFWEHTPATACFTVAVVCVLHAWNTQNARWLALAGSFASLATFLRTENVAMSAGLVLALVWLRWRWAFHLGGGYVLTSLAWLSLNVVWMGQPLGRNWAYSSNALAAVPLFAGLRDTGGWFVPYVLFNTPRVIAFDLTPKALVFAMASVVVALFAPVWRRLRGLVLIGYIGLIGVCAGVLVHPLGYRSVHGLVLIAPHIVFATWLYARPHTPRELAFRWVVPSVCATMAGVYALRAWDAAGGLQWGPRYLLSLFPLLVVAGVGGLAHGWTAPNRVLRSGVLVAYAACVLIGVGYQLRGLRAAVTTTQYYEQTRRAVLQLDRAPVVTRCFWIGAVIPDLYWTGNVFALRGAEPVESWLAAARAVGLDSYYVLDMDLCEPTTLDDVASRRVTNPSGLSFEWRRLDDLQ